MLNAGVAQILLLGSVDAQGNVQGVTAVQASIPVDRSTYIYNTIIIRGNGTLSGGTILIEEADWMPSELPYSGGWSALQTVAANTLTGGNQVAIHFAASAYAYLRARISAPIAGGGSVVVFLRSSGS